MKLKRLLAFALLCGSLAFAQTKTPLVQPHWSFPDQSGAACAGCTLGTFLAGTTTPTPTYTDASGATPNTNPIILDASGSASIWVGTPTLKLVLKDSFGTLIWTADNIPPGGGSGSGGCGIAGAITFENATVTGLDCDQYIKINKTLHSINVGGTLPATHFQMTNLSAILAGWTLDVSSPTTAALSVGGGTKAAGKYIDGGTGAWTALPGGIGTVTSVTVTPTGPLTGGGTVTTSGTIALGLPHTGSAANVVTASGVPADGCGQYVSGNLTSTGAACATNPTFTGTSHYQILPSGLILQWGTTPTFDTGPVTVTFPTAFPHACLMKPMVTQDLDVSVVTRIWESGSCTTTNFVVRNDGNGAATYFVIGW